MEISAVHRGDAFEASLRTPLPSQLAVGLGTALFLDGRVTTTAAELADLRLLVDGAERPLMGWGMAPPRSAGSDYWWGIVGFSPVSEPTVSSLGLRARLRHGEIVDTQLGSLRLLPDLPELDRSAAAAALEAVGSEGGRDEPLVAICMASFEPDIELFARQVESIRSQRHRRWICLISDDASPAAVRAEMRAMLGSDERFVFSEAEENIGFYGNFERALRLVPPEADLVALCDQDDQWREDKLGALIEALAGGACLAYSDMRIVGRRGELISDTYWSFRRNNHTDFGSLIVANTVTGAASLFERGLLERILPFPPRYSNLFHDHWIAQVAMAVGSIAYVDRPLYDYVQHDAAAIGHLAANGLGRYSASLLRRLRTGWQRLRAHRFRPAWRAPYFNVYCRIALTVAVLRMRSSDVMEPGRERVLDAIGEPGPRARWLARRAVRDLGGVTETLGRELVMLVGLAWRLTAELRKRARSAVTR